MTEECLVSISHLCTTYLVHGAPLGLAPFSQLLQPIWKEARVASSNWLIAILKKHPPQKKASSYGLLIKS